MAQTKADLRTFGERVGRINSGKTTRPDGVLTSQRELNAAHAQQNPKAKGKDLLLVPVALALGVASIAVGTLAGPFLTSYVLGNWPDAADLLQAMPARICISIAFGVLAIILFNLNTTKRQMAFATGAAVTYFGGVQVLTPLGEQVAALQTFI